MLRIPLCIWRENQVFLSKIYWLTVTKKLLRWTLLCFRMFRVTKNLLDKSGVGNHDTPSKSFCLTVPSSFIDEPFCVSEQFRLRKILWQWGKYHDFLSKVCCLTIPKNIVSGTLLCPKKCDKGSFHGSEGEGVSWISVKIFCLSAKNFVVDALSLSLNSGIGKIFCLRKSGFSFKLVFSDSALIFSRGNLLCFRKCQLTKYL